MRRVLLNHGFTLGEDNVRTQWRGKCQYVTGLSVVDSTSPRIPVRTKRRLRLELYYAVSGLMYAAVPRIKTPASVPCIESVGDCVNPPSALPARPGPPWGRELG